MLFLVALGCAKQTGAPTLPIPSPPLRAAHDASVGTTVDELLGEPGAWTDRKVVGLVHVASTMAERGLWLEGTDGGDALLAVLESDPWEAVKPIRPGQYLYLLEATVRRPGDVRTDAMTRRLRKAVQAQPVVIVVDGDDVLVVPET